MRSNFLLLSLAIKMRKYFTHHGNDTQGPFSLEELKQKGISQKTPIWYEGLPEWTIAEEIEEINDTINFKKKFKIDLGSEPNIYILTILLIILLTSLYKLNNRHASENYQKNRITTSQIQITHGLNSEKYQPNQHLQVKISSQVNLDKKLELKGFVVNSAYSIDYKDASIKIFYHNKEKNILAEEDYIIHDVFPSKTSKPFSIPVKKYHAVDFIDIKVYKASINH